MVPAGVLASDWHRRPLSEAQPPLPPPSLPRALRTGRTAVPWGRGLGASAPPRGGRRPRDTHGILGMLSFLRLHLAPIAPPAGRRSRLLRQRQAVLCTFNSIWISPALQTGSTGIALHSSDPSSFEGQDRSKIDRHISRGIGPCITLFFLPQFLLTQIAPLQNEIVLLHPPFGHSPTHRGGYHRFVVTGKVWAALG